MTPNDYQKEAGRTHPSSEQDLIIEGRMAKIAMLLHAQVGITTELGELADTIKKYAIYGKQLDTDNIKEELGDLLWYIALAADAVGYPLEEIMEQNIDKLRIRYPEKFTEELAAERRDKQ